MSDLKTNNNNGLCYKELDGIKNGDVFEYISERGVLRHYVVSFLFKRMNTPFATILFPDGYAETYPISSIKKDQYIKNINWETIKDEFLNEANMYK